MKNGTIGTPRVAYDVAAAVHELLDAIGEDVTRDGLLATPDRVARMWAEVASGLHEDPRRHLITTFEADHDEMVMVRDIPMYSMCEHHLVPFMGQAHVAYIPNDDGRVIGLSKVARLVDGYARRPQVQERLGEQIADAIASALDTRGVLVVLEASHECVTMRGDRQSDASTVTIAARGELSEPAARAELIALLGASRA